MVWRRSLAACGGLVPPVLSPRLTLGLAGCSGERPAPSPKGSDGADGMGLITGPCDFSWERNAALGLGFTARAGHTLSRKERDHIPKLADPQRGRGLLAQEVG